ncbi:inward rectifier potassium channel [Anopheles darlingi]|uniref:Inward rectifier potassium channel n=1 Tax=Anopheles darlingi TaxID=43151 RepID=W5JTS7_ANODA|nr:ATP-sensitive inward rectifier potassium channel 8-like [Anopheles darlingi]ETN66688.1 inward rectifier potassium channel [Anopheles darlingi]
MQEQQHLRHQKQQQDNSTAQEDMEYRFSRPIKIVDYDNERYSWSAPGSPYHIRRPAFDRNRFCFCCSWIFFAILWFLIAYAHGDLNHDPSTGERLGDGTKPCVEGTTSFTGFLLFSVETQVSTGYGVIVPTEECPEAFFLLLAQILFGLVIGGAMVGVVYAKMIRTPKRSFEMKFSKRAVICQRDGRLCLVFRVCDHKQQHIIGTKLTASILEPRRYPGTNLVERCESRLRLQNNGHILALWPITVCHVIDRYSPLYDISAAELLERKFEIVITMTGATWTTGQMTQARTSYLPMEILWGHRFQNIIEYDGDRGCYVAQNEQLDLVEEVDTPLCSARFVSIEIQHENEK